MTDNIKKFLEIASNESDDFKEKLLKADKAETIAIAAEKGITLTDEDFDDNTELTPDELEAVAGGKLTKEAIPLLANFFSVGLWGKG